MDIVNIIKTLRAAGIPARRCDRDDRRPILLVGGDIARMNPAALAPFVDVFALGDGERLVPGIARLLRSGLAREQFLQEAAKLPGFFVPAVHGPRAEAADSSRVVIQQPMSRKEISPHFEVPHTTIVTPRTELADKLLIEISRGCSEMCRFCWAAYAMAPLKQYPAASIIKVAREARPLTGRAGLIATAVCDHPEITQILTGLADLDYHIALSSIKIDAIEDPILEVLARQGEKALAIAPEAGNERLRRHINKKVSDSMLREKVRLVFARGFTRLKLYLQVGLPTESRSAGSSRPTATASPRSCVPLPRERPASLRRPLPGHSFRSDNAFPPLPPGEGRGEGRAIAVSAPSSQLGIRNSRFFLLLLLLAVSAAALDFPPLAPPQSMFRAHRERFLGKLPANAIAILRSAPPRTFSNDVEYAYRQDSDFYYLTGWEEPDAVAVLRPNAPAGKRYVLFVRGHDARREAFEGKRSGPEGAVSQYGADEAFAIDEFFRGLARYETGSRSFTGTL